MAAIAFGLVLGSYAVTAGIRFARGESTLASRSHCDGCGVFLPFSSTVPIVSYVQAGGRCRACGMGIDRLHLVGEVAGALVMVTALSVSLERGALLALLGLILIAATSIDLRVGRLPNPLTAAAAGVGAALAWTRSSESLVTGLIASLTCTMILVALRAVRRRRGRDPGIGLGDVKLMAALAIWLGAFTPWVIGGAAVLGLIWIAIVRPADGRLAFGPMIATAAWIVGAGMELSWWPTIN